MTPVFLALGGNLGSVEQSFQLAADELARLSRTRVVDTSSVYRFPAVGKAAGSEFCNAAAEIETSLEPLELLVALQRIEDNFGRVRDTRWGPRPLDIDVVFFGDRVIELPRLRVPHPACWYRRFVLDPLAEIAPAIIHPEKRINVSALQQRLLARPLPVVLVGANIADRRQLVAEVSRDFPEVAFLTDWPSLHLDEAMGNEPALLIWLGPERETAGTEFESLPLVPRLDASAFRAPAVESLRDVLHSALGR